MTQSTKLIVSVSVHDCNSGQAVPGLLRRAFRTANTASSLPAIVSAQALRQEAAKSNASVMHAGDNARTSPSKSHSVAAASHRCNITRCRLRSNWTLEARVICVQISTYTHIDCIYTIVHRTNCTSAPMTINLRTQRTRTYPFQALLS